MQVQERAHAKINLNLHIHGRRPDGYHQLSSLVAFAADVYDTVTLTAAPGFGLDVAGPFSEGLIDQTNLIETAFRLAREQSEALEGGHFRLEKVIPVASGVGGGSADAAAALRALAQLNGLGNEPSELLAVAPRVGADVPVCFSGEGRNAAFMQGIGEKVYRPTERPYWPSGAVYAVLVNPGVEVSTGEVFRRLNAAPVASHNDIAAPKPFADRSDLIDYLRSTRNDMEPAAVVLAPVIGEVLQQLSRLPTCLLARMSGSGATCFGLFQSGDDANKARAALLNQHSDWWVVASRLD